MDDHSQEISVNIQSAADFHVDEVKIKNLASKICKLLGVSNYLLGIEIVSAEYIKSLNASYRQKDSVTDVLSFPQINWDQPILIESEKLALVTDKLSGPPQSLGDIVVCLDKAAANAIDIGQSIDREFCFLLVHGLLHLCGHDHIEKEEETVMLEQQRSIMTLLTSPDDQILWSECVSTQGKGH